MGTRVVLITGALTGIGRAAARAFAREGHRTVVAGRHEEAGQKLVTELRALGTEAEFFRTDVRHEDEVRNLVDKTVARFGRLDVAVNNAGTEGQPGPLTEQSAETVVARIEKGEVVDPTSYYFRINTLFETANANYDWLNRVVAVGIGHRRADGPIYHDGFGN